MTVAFGDVHADLDDHGGNQHLKSPARNAFITTSFS